MGNFAAVIASEALPSGIIEGLNNEAKVTISKTYGFRAFKMGKFLLYHVLGKLPAQKLTHIFCGTAEFSKFVDEFLAAIKLFKEAT